MEMITTGHAAAAGAADNISLGNRLALITGKTAQMGVQAEQPQPMVNDSGIAVNSQ